MLHKPVVRRMVVNELEKVPEKPSDVETNPTVKTPEERIIESSLNEPKFQKIETCELPESIFQLEFARVKLALALDFIKKGESILVSEKNLELRKII